jgi:hypothetical protein
MLARDLAPPPTLPSPVGVTLAAAMLAGISALLVIGATLPGSSDQDAWFLSMVTTALAVLCGLTAVRRQRRIQRDGALTAVARDLWQRMLYCSGCGSVFLPGGRAVPAPRLHAALRTTAAYRLGVSSAA